MFTTATLSHKFTTEAEMVAGLVHCLDEGNSPWGALHTTREWNYRSGFTDILARQTAGEIIAIEAKLKDWRRASHQAYRNTVFACRSYVAMPAEKAMAAAKNAAEFEKYGVGLCAFDGQTVAILIEAKTMRPLIPWLRARAELFFDQDACGSEPTKPRGRRRNLSATEGSL